MPDESFYYNITPNIVLSGEASSLQGFGATLGLMAGKVSDQGLGFGSSRV